jgi:hypothetical protein
MRFYLALVISRNELHKGLNESGGTDWNGLLKDYNIALPIYNDLAVYNNGLGSPPLLSCKIGIGDQIYAIPLVWLS